MVAEHTDGEYEENVRSLLRAVGGQVTKDAAARLRREEREESQRADEAERQSTERELERLAHLKALSLVGSLAWQEVERARLLREDGVYSVERAIRAAYGELWSLSERLSRINDDEESETGKQLHMDMTNLADLEWAHGALPSAKLRLLWDWCVIGREKRPLAGSYAYHYFLERTSPVLVKGKYAPVYRCRPKSVAAAARGLRVAGIPADEAHVEGLLALATANVVATLCHEGVLDKDGMRP